MHGTSNENRNTTETIFHSLLRRIHLAETHYFYFKTYNTIVWDVRGTDSDFNAQIDVLRWQERCKLASSNVNGSNVISSCNKQKSAPTKENFYFLNI